MTWRRIAPWLIGVIALVAIFIDLPRTTLGLSWLPDEVAGVEFRTVLGLDLQGGLRVTLQAEPQSDEPITDEQTWRPRATSSSAASAGIGVSEPQVRTETGRRRVAADRGRGARRQRPAPGARPRRLDRPAPVHRSAGPRRRSSRCGARTSADLLESGAVRESVRRRRDRRRAAWRPAVGTATRSASQFTLSESGSRHLVQLHDRRTSDQPGPIALDGRVITTPEHQRARSAAADDHHRSARRRRRTRSSARTSTTRCASARCRSR